MPENVMSTITALLSVTGALISFRFSWRTAHNARVSAAEALALKFRKPLIQAAFNLETRLYNLLDLGRPRDRVWLRLREQRGAHDG
jgi:hypothetical protein